MLQCVVVCCSMLQYVAVCCSMLQYVAVCCSVLQCVKLCDVLQCVVCVDLDMCTFKGFISYEGLFPNLIGLLDLIELFSDDRFTCSNNCTPNGLFSD